LGRFALTLEEPMKVSFVAGFGTYTPWMHGGSGEAEGL
jgi:hypothetical protein